MNTLEKEMREWLLECFSDEYDQEQINELGYLELQRSINKYYDGGLNSFIAESVLSGWSIVEA